MEGEADFYMVEDGQIDEYAFRFDHRGHACVFWSGRDLVMGYRQVQSSYLNDNFIILII